MTLFDDKHFGPYNLPLNLQRMTWDKATVIHMSLGCV